MAASHEPTSNQREGAVLFADVCGSTPLFQRLGNEAAARIVNARIDGMKRLIDTHNGVFVKASGDDVLCWFPEAASAVRAVLAMLEPPEPGGLDIHAGLQWGPFVYHDNDIFGDCVNTAARLLDLAKPKEVLVGGECVSQLHGAMLAQLSPVSPLRLKGRQEHSRIYSAQVSTGGPTTRYADGAGQNAEVQNDVIIAHGDSTWRIGEGEKLSVGREDDNTVCVPEPSVSRKHATITVGNGLLEFNDHSSYGSYVITPDGEEFKVFRRQVVLTGAGQISLARPGAEGDGPQLRFEVVARDA